MLKKMALRFSAALVIISLVLACMPATKSFALDESALEVNSTINGIINSGQKIWYSLIVPEDGDISFSLGAAKQYFYVDMYLCNEEMYEYNYRTDTHDKWFSYGSAIGASSTPAEMKFEGLRAGKYYVLLRAHPSDFPGVVDTSDYTLACMLNVPLLKSDKEPNDTFDNATPIYLDYAGAGHISYGKADTGNLGEHRDDNDWYKFTSTCKGTLKITFQAIPGVFSDAYELRIYKAGFTSEYDFISRDYTGGAATGTKREVKGLAAGTYYINLKGYWDYFSPYNISISLTPDPGTGPTATPTKATVLVNGVNKAFDAYNINGSNYFKLRDIAYVLNGTQKQFGVGWDAAKNAISLASGSGYVSVGGEMAVSGNKLSKMALPTSSKIYKDGVQVTLTAYLINGNNYFKLRDLAAKFNFGLGWNGATSTITIETAEDYVAP